MAETYGLGGVINSKARSGERWCKKKDREGEEENGGRSGPQKKVCRICERTWVPLNPIAAGCRDICYRPECEKKREKERRDRRKKARRAARRAMKRKKKKNRDDPGSVYDAGKVPEPR